MEIKTYQQALNYLEGFIGKIVFNVKSSKDPLERMRIFLSLLGNPQDKFKSVLIGGTSGKGSTSCLISHILTTAGYKTGFTLSPHLQKINERLQINGKEISDAKFTQMIDSIVQTIELMKKMKIGEPSYFEIIVGLAFKYFANQKVDIAVVEVGMGGEFDATNTLSPLIAILTNVGLDHTNILGNTVEKIAKTKAGIIKGERGKGKGESKLLPSPFTLHPLVISGVRQPSVIKIVEKRCEETGSKLSLLWRDFGYKIKKESVSGTEFDFISHEKTLEGLKLSLLGQYQAENASLAIKTILELNKLGFSHFAKASRDKKVLEENIRQALSTAFFPGRFEVLRCHPEFISGSPARRQVSLCSKEMLNQASPDQHDKGVTLILDGAHNPAKMQAFIFSLQKMFPAERKVFVIGFKFDKNIKEMLKEILNAADEIIITEFDRATDVSIHASGDAKSMRDKLLRMKYQGKITVEKNSKKALQKAVNILKTQYPNDPAAIIVTGSLYLVGEVRGYLFSANKKFI